jgi:ribose transport system substrate-binding protein
MGRLTLSFLLLTAALFGCGTSNDKPTPKGERTTKGIIGVSVLTLTNPFFKVIGDSISEEAAQHGYEVMVVSGERQAARQQGQVKDFIVRKCAAIVLCPCDSKAIGPVIQEANAAGIPVFTADIKCLAVEPEVVCHIATDNYQGGREAANAMIEALGEKGGKIVILDFPVVESCQLRTKGFKEVLAAHNAGRDQGQITIVSELDGGGLKDIGYKAAEDALQAHPDLDAIFAINDPSALGARAALEKAGKADRVKLIGFDGQPEGKQAIKEGKIYADPVQFPDKIGRTTAQAIFRHFDGEKVEKEILIPTALYRKADAEKDPELK